MYLYINICKCAVNAFAAVLSNKSSGYHHIAYIHTHTLTMFDSLSKYFIIIGHTQNAHLPSQYAQIQ